MATSKLCVDNSELNRRSERSNDYERLASTKTCYIRVTLSYELTTRLRFVKLESLSK